MTNGDTKELWRHPSKTECLCVTTGADSSINRGRIATSRAIVAVEKLRSVENRRLEDASLISLRAADHGTLHRITWSKKNRPNLEIDYRIPSEARPGQVEQLHIHLPEGSIHLSDVMDLDLAEAIAAHVADMAKQALDRGWAKPGADEMNCASWSTGIHEIVAERLLSNPVAATVRADAVELREIMLPTPWSPVMVRMNTASGSTIPAVPLDALHAGDPLLAAVSRSAPMMIGIEGGGSGDDVSLYAEGHVHERVSDPAEIMRCIALVQEQAR